jgi:Tfp pilus assembly protein PilE
VNRRESSGITRIEWILIVLIVAIGGAVLVPMHLQGEERRRHMETVAVPLIEALDRYRAAHKSYPDSLQKLVPAYLPELPGCNPRSASSAMAYYVEPNSGEYSLNCGIGMFAKRQYSSRTKGWSTRD